MIVDPRFRSCAGACGATLTLRLATTAIVLALMGCAAISDSGPSRRDVEARAAATNGAIQDRSLLDYILARFDVTSRPVAARSRT